MQERIDTGALAKTTGIVLVISLILNGVTLGIQLALGVEEAATIVLVCGCLGFLMNAAYGAIYAAFANHTALGPAALGGALAPAGAVVMNSIFLGISNITTGTLDEVTSQLGGDSTALAVFGVSFIIGLCLGAAIAAAISAAGSAATTAIRRPSV